MRILRWGYAGLRGLVVDIIRFIDWKFITAIIVLAVVVPVVHDYWKQDRRIDALIATANSENERDHAEDAHAAKERDELLRLVRELRDANVEQAEYIKALVIYLRNRGVYLPPELDPPAASTDHRTTRADSPEEKAAKERAQRRDDDPKGQGSPATGSKNGNGGGKGNGGSGSKSDGKGKSDDSNRGGNGKGKGKDK